ncbi:MAG TPA: acetate--CoA ligase family protein [Dehalococcoidales bacterium]|nr:acetate--CoA ligase family protein [Dehalococcoidales bacterium]
MTDVSNIIAGVRKQGRTVLTEIEAKQAMNSIGVGTTKTQLARSQKGAAAISDEIGFPVVLKIASPDITHKTDAGGVKVGLKTKAEVSRAFTEITAAAREKFPKAEIEGVTVQNVARPGIEIIIGTFKDPQFGPVIMFGLGGIFVEILKDVAFRIVPIRKRDAAEMIKEIKGYALLNGYRGHEPASIPVLEDILMKVSDFVEKTPAIKEIDLNPIFAYKDSAVAVDARIVLEEEK